jgi:hypothetical protein
LRFQGDFAQWDCPNSECHMTNTTVTKDGVQRYYWCNHCGTKVEAKKDKEKRFETIFIKADDGHRLKSPGQYSGTKKPTQEEIDVSAYGDASPLADFIYNLDEGDKVKVVIELVEEAKK